MLDELDVEEGEDLGVHLLARRSHRSAAASDADFQKAALKLEAIGFAVGHRLVERYTRDRPRFSDTLEIIKFICKGPVAIAINLIAKL